MSFNREFPFLRKYWRNIEFRQAIEKRARRKGAASEKPEKQVVYFLDQLKRISKKEKGKEHLLNLILYRKYIIKPENISDNYIKNILLGDFAESKGYQREQLKNQKIKSLVIELFEKETGQKFEEYSIPENERNKIISSIIESQKLSLKLWLDYLTSSEAENYPPDFKYWVFGEILKLGVYDQERKKFNKREKNTVAPFPELNPQALSMVLDLIIKQNSNEGLDLAYLNLNREKIEELKKIIKAENFGDLYSWCLNYIKSLKTPEERLIITSGEWKLFEIGSNVNELIKAIQNYDTGWCIANESTAQNYLKNNNILIYFSQDETGKNTIPRVAIVMSRGNRIYQIRGIAKNQNLDPYILPIVEAKLKEIPNEYQRWAEIINDIKKLTEIHLKILKGEDLTKEELVFIYQINRPIIGLGLSEDPRIKEIIDKRKDVAIKDINEIFKGIEDHNGDINLSFLTSAEGLKLPRKIKGDLNLSNITSAKGVKLPQKIEGNLYLYNLTSAEGLELPEEIIGGNIYFGKLSPADIKKLKKEYPHFIEKFVF